MFVDNAVVKNYEGKEKYDRFAIASTLFDLSFKESACSVIEANILKSCEGCNLKYLCDSIDEVVRDYTEKTTVVTSTFKFGS